MDLFTNYESHTFTFASSASGAVIEQEILGWSAGGCAVVWSDLLPRVVAFHGEKLCSGKTVLELGAGCGLVGLVAAHWASRVDITDGDPQEVSLIEANVEANAPKGASCSCSALHLDWGSQQAAAAKESGALVKEGYDVILAAQVVYVPDAIKPLVETIASLLAQHDGAECILYNDAVACTATQGECRALLDAALTAHNLRQEPALDSRLTLPPVPRVAVGHGQKDDAAAAAAGKQPVESEAIRWFPHDDAYLLRITRVAAPPR